MRTKSGEAEYGRNFGVPEKICINFGAEHCFISSSMPFSRRKTSSASFMGIIRRVLTLPPCEAALVPRHISHVLHYHAHVDLLEKIFK